jgi:hypothetical protein
MTCGTTVLLRIKQTVVEKQCKNALQFAILRLEVIEIGVGRIITGAASPGSSPSMDSVTIPK